MKHDSIDPTHAERKDIQAEERIPQVAGEDTAVDDVVDALADPFDLDFGIDDEGPTAG